MRRPWILAALLLVTVVAGLLVALTQDRGAQEPTAPTPDTTQAPSTSSPPGLDGVPRRVLIYDSLSREFPNPALTSALVQLFESAGFQVNVYQGFNASLDPLVAISEYGVVILRAHGAYNGDPETGKPLGAYVYTGLYYYEAQVIYDGYVDEGLEKGFFAKAIIPARGGESPLYLAVSPLFFEENLARLDGTIVFFTGCYGADDDRLANVFLAKDAQAYLGWKGNVTWTHADNYLLEWARALVETGDPVEAYEAANTAIGPDPYTGAEAVAFWRAGLVGGQG